MTRSLRIEPAVRIAGEVQLPGDKSISHRLLLLAMLGAEPVTLDNLAPGRDIAATVTAIEQFGARVERVTGRPGRVVVHGAGSRPAAPAEPIDAANSGTLARLLAGVATRCQGVVRIDGDESLRRRPMRRVTVPLELLGAQVRLDGDHLPMEISAPEPLKGGALEVRVPSAQVAGALMFAATGAREPLSLQLPTGLRSHTQVHLARAGVRIDGHGTELTVHPQERLQVPDTRIPGDMSAAAPLITAAALLPGSLLRLPGVGIDPERTGLIAMLDRSGGNVGIHARRSQDGEPVADLEIGGARPNGIRVSGRDAAAMIDELPLLALMLHFTRGETRVRGAGELRHKESDRIATTVRALRSIGVAIEETRDGFLVRGSGTRPQGGRIDAEGDHRIAILGVVAGLVSRTGVTIDGIEAAAVSWPDAVQVLEAVAER